VDTLSGTDAVVAIAAAGVAAASLLLGVVLAFRLRALRSAQRAVLGADDADLVAHAAGLQREFALLRTGVEESAAQLGARVERAEQRLDGAIAHHALVRYDAYNEMSGRQSMSIALLDASRSGVVVSSIHHRDQARLYAKTVRNGEGELELSPEEAEAVAQALAGVGRAASSAGR